MNFSSVYSVSSMATITARQISLILILSTMMLHFAQAQPLARHDLSFDSLASVWDEAIPLGNGTIGALVWQQGNDLRFSLDRADLWDMRPMKGLHRKEFTYKWIYNKVLNNDYGQVQEYFDKPYDLEPAPSKIPGGALSFSLPVNLKVKSVRLSLSNALCEVIWDNGMTMKTFVHAEKTAGWFRFEHVDKELLPELIAPQYEGKEQKGEVNSLVGTNLSELGYKQGKVNREANRIIYTQQGAEGFSYEIAVEWKKSNEGTIEGVWSISSQYPGKKVNPTASSLAEEALKNGFDGTLTSHLKWWTDFWSKSAIHLPDTLLEKQWYLEQYKFGSSARRGAPPISLQAVWTADNGRIPPWKGDYHHDLNTQLSYWPAYSGNHLEEALGYLDHLDQNKSNYKRYTKLFFDKPGIAVPGVTTLDGTEMGGWVAYSFSPTVSSWLAHHYYLQWKYSMDRVFLKNRAYPWIREVCIFLESITVKDKQGNLQLPIGASPEINDNTIKSWFRTNTNYDLALMKFSFTAGAELAGELGLTNEQNRWKKLLALFSDYALTKNDELMFAATQTYEVSHRHFSHLMAIYPLNLLKWEDGSKARSIITNTIKKLDEVGPDNWCGYSYAWLGSLKAHAKDGEGAAKALSIFAKAFCLPNSFHANGDQTKSGYSSFTYRPFTLEGNFAFACGIQEMLMQSYAGYIHLFPAVPQSWNDISFDSLRAEGAFLVSAKKSAGKVTEVKITAENGGKAKLKMELKGMSIFSREGVTAVTEDAGLVNINFATGGTLILKAN